MIMYVLNRDSYQGACKLCELLVSDACSVLLTSSTTAAASDAFALFTVTKHTRGQLCDHGRPIVVEPVLLYWNALKGMRQGEFWSLHGPFSLKFNSISIHRPLLWLSPQTSSFAWLAGFPKTRCSASFTHKISDLTHIFFPSASMGRTFLGGLMSNFTRITFGMTFFCKDSCKSL
jgi:hypothetical protein